MSLQNWKPWQLDSWPIVALVSCRWDSSRRSLPCAARGSVAWDLTPFFATRQLSAAQGIPHHIKTQRMRLEVSHAPVRPLKQHCRARCSQYSQDSLARLSRYIRDSLASARTPACPTCARASAAPPTPSGCGRTRTPSTAPPSAAPPARFPRTKLAPPPAPLRAARRSRHVVACARSRSLASSRAVSFPPSHRNAVLASASVVRVSACVRVRACVRA